MDCASDERCDEICSWSHPSREFTGCAIMCVKRTTIGIPEVFEATIIKRVESGSKGFHRASIIHADAPKQKTDWNAAATKIVRKDSVSESLQQMSSSSISPPTTNETSDLINLSAPPVRTKYTSSTAGRYTLPLGGVEKKKAALLAGNDSSTGVFGDNTNEKATTPMLSNDSSQQSKTSIDIRAQNYTSQENGDIVYFPDEVDNTINSSIRFADPVVLNNTDGGEEVLPLDETIEETLTTEFALNPLNLAIESGIVSTKGHAFDVLENATSNNSIDEQQSDVFADHLRHALHEAEKSVFAMNMKIPESEHAALKEPVLIRTNSVISENVSADRDGVMKRKTTSDVGMNGMLTALARSTLGDDDNERTNAAKLLGSSDATLFAEAITELSTAVSPEESTSTSDVTLTVKPANIRIIKRHTSNIDRHETRRMRRLQWPGRL
uniref:Uncharacterized protein n=1 Tax=Parascaris univalens TaxID=6257 RepID=A0A915B9Q0_PARUN